VPVNLSLAPAKSVAGVQLTTVAAGIKVDGSADMVLIRLAEQSSTAAVFTLNAFCAAPVILCREHLSTSKGATQALLINSGNANAGTGKPGYDMAVGHCATVAKALSVDVSSVLPFSTGVIGELLPDEKMKAGIQEAASRLVAASDTSATATATATAMACTDQLEHWQAAARGIMTTDTVPKITSRQVTIDGQLITITGMAKGSGMIQPNMATMLSYVFTDANVSVKDLDAALRDAVDVSFNSITVDSDTSTNDAVVLSATGASGLVLSPEDTSSWQLFTDALTQLCKDLAQAIIRDGEGATKFITVRVNGGRSVSECKTVAYAVANSPLVKTAMFASDANVGRLLMAIGKADIDALDASKVRVSLGDLCVFENGGNAAGYTEELGADLLAKEEILVVIDLARGEYSAEVYTSDLSHDYVTINADYRT